MHCLANCPDPSQALHLRMPVSVDVDRDSAYVARGVMETSHGPITRRDMSFFFASHNNRRRLRAARPRLPEGALLRSRDGIGPSSGV